MDYLSYEAEDFALDESFYQWVINPDVESEAFWRQWIATYPHKKKDIDLARQLVLLAQNDPDRDPSPATVDRLWKGIKLRRETDQLPDHQPAWNWRWTRLAAVVTAVSLLAFWGYRQWTAAGQVYQTAYSEIRRLHLPDGTAVTLNANSRLRTIGNWQDAADRKVWLEGEAFFHVSKKRFRGQPVKFIVHTGDLDIAVKGTQFTVNTRQEQTWVALAEGHVDVQLNEVKKGKKTIAMKPGDQVAYSAESQGFSVRHVEDTTPFSSWKDNRWILNKTPLSEVAVLIRETYGFTVQFETTVVAAQEVSGIVPSDNLDDLLSSLQNILPVEIEKKDKLIIVKPST